MLRAAQSMFAITGFLGMAAILPADEVPRDVLLTAAGVRPSPQQAAWQELEFTCFTHFGVNTFTDREWGEASEDPKTFNPAALNAKQWASACKTAG